jgi:RNA polymerase sigma-70 factor (ECF subfamily)
MAKAARNNPEPIDGAAPACSLQDLIDAVARGDQGALRRLYERESRRLYGIALRIVRRPEIAAEVLQDAFLQIWQKAASYAPERGDPAAWLTGIVRYRGIDAVRKLGRELPSADPEQGEAVAPDTFGESDANLARGALRRCLDELDDNQRRCILLAFVDGLTHAEIAARLSAPLGSVKSWVRRGLVSLRRCLDG